MLARALSQRCTSGAANEQVPPSRYVPMVTLSTSVQLKLDRRRELRDEIRSKAISWADSDPYRFFTEEVDRGDR
jgi:hypothetical protein